MESWKNLLSMVADAANASPLSPFLARLASIPSPISWLMAFASPVALAASSNFDASVIAGSITAIAVSLTGIISLFGSALVRAWRQFKEATIEIENKAEAARIENQKAWDAANKDSLTSQLKVVQDSLDKARASLHELRNDAQAKETRFQEEIERLRDELQETRDDLQKTRNLLSKRDAEFAQLLTTIRETASRTASNSDRIDSLEQQAQSGSSDGEGASPAHA